AKQEKLRTEAQLQAQRERDLEGNSDPSADSDFKSLYKRLSSRMSASFYIVEGAVKNIQNNYTAANETIYNHLPEWMKSVIQDFRHTSKIRTVFWYCFALFFICV